MKTCFKCDRELPISEFYKHARMADGRLGKCKECTKADTAEHRMANPELHRGYSRIGRRRRADAETPAEKTERLERRRIKQRDWHRANTERGRIVRRRWAGLPEPTRPEPNNCENCDRPRPATAGLCLDHDHATGKFRGWLCMPCNAGIGLLGDSQAGVMKALIYLEGKL